MAIATESSHVSRFGETRLQVAPAAMNEALEELRRLTDLLQMISETALFAKRGDCVDAPKVVDLAGEVASLAGKFGTC